MAFHFPVEVGWLCWGSIHYNDSSITSGNSSSSWARVQWKYGLPAGMFSSIRTTIFCTLSNSQCLVVVWWRQFPEGKSGRFQGWKEKAQSFPHLRRSLNTRGLRVWREEGRLIALIPSGTSLMKEAVAAQLSFLTLDQKSSKINTFASIPRSSCVATDTFLVRA